jgi:hypothetical protein
LALFVRHLQAPLPSQYTPVPQDVFLATLLPPPHVPFDWQLSPVVHALLSLQALATHVAVVEEQELQPVQAEPAFFHVPVASHVWGCVELHCLAPGLQLPAHAPVAVLQRNGQAKPMFAQVPLGSQT